MAERSSVTLPSGGAGSALSLYVTGTVPVRSSSPATPPLIAGLTTYEPSGTRKNPCGVAPESPFGARQLKLRLS